MSGALIAAAVVVATSGARLSAPPVVAVTITDQVVQSSPRSVPLGVVTFHVANRGTRSHSFRIAGKATPTVAGGQRAVFRVDFARPGRYAYSATGVPASPRHTLIVLRPAPVPSGTLQGPGATTTTQTSSQPCSSPTTTAVTVTMTDTMGPNAYKFSPSSIPCGTVTFQLINAGQDQHGLAIAVSTGAQTSTSPTLEASQTASFIVTLATTGSYRWWDSAGEGVETTFGTIGVH